MDCRASAVTDDALSALTALTAGVMVVDGDGRVVFANPSASRILQRTLLGAPLAELLAPVDELLREAADPTSHGERPLRLPDGTTTLLQLSVGVAAENGHRTILFQEIAHVVALRRERDRLLQLATLGDALPSILHELRNPLAAVTTSLEVLVEDTDGHLRDDLHAILWEVRRMGLTLQGVGGLARPFHTARHCSADLAVCEACRILEPTAIRRGIALDVNVPAMPLLPLDWGVVSGVVFNLVKNAIDACQPGDTISVLARLESDHTFVLSVSDTGAGMSKEVLTRCRELFFTSKEHGSGVGLALCQQIAKSSGGRLDIESEEGAGTVVTLSVPIHS